MSSCQTLDYKESKICIVENNFSIDELLSQLEYHKLYEDDLERLKISHRKQEYLALRLALKKVLNGQEKKIIYLENGKPILEDGSHNISFSHCRYYIAVMTHPLFEVGIDIETPTEKLIYVHEKFLGKKELDYYRKTKDYNYLRVAWSAKEALFKIIGLNAFNFAEQLYIPPIENIEKGFVKAIHTLTNKEYLVHFEINEHYTLAYCLNDENQ